MVKVSLMKTNKNTVAASTKRGDTVARGGNAGLYVGTDRAGLVWIAWDGEGFARMCAAFDAMK